MPQEDKINGRPLQWDDLSNHGRKIVSDNVRETGMNLPAIGRESSARSMATFERTGNAKAKVKANSSAATAEQFVAKPVSLQSAANSRQKLYQGGLDDRRAQNPGDPHQVTPTGAGWYFEHHKDIATVAEKNGFPRDHAIAASGVMSPMNSPDFEKRAVGAMMDAYANHKVTITPEVHQHLAKAGIDVTEHLGKEVHFDNLPTGSLAHLSDSKIRDSVPTTANLKEVSLGGTRQNITRAENVLMGNTHPDDAVDPHSAPKVWSYIHNTRQAVPNSPTHVEYMGRVHQDALVRSGQVDKHQQALDLYGHNEQTLPRDHLLSPKSNTVEDTWQNAATFDQPKTMAGGKTSVFKSAGSLPETYPIRGVKTRTNPETGKRDTAIKDGRVGNPAVTHAFNNRATQKTAESLGRESGVSVPPVAVQEVGWVQMRKDAGKDSEHAAAVRGAEKPDALQGHVAGQGGLFSATPHLRDPEAAKGNPVYKDHLPGAGKAGDDHDYSAGVDNPEADMRKWAAIGNNHRISESRKSRAISPTQFGGVL